MTADGKDEMTKSGGDTPPQAKPPDQSRGRDANTESATPESGTTGDATPPAVAPDAAEAEEEVGGRRKGLDPTRYGDWEKNGRAIDF